MTKMFLLLWVACIFIALLCTSNDAARSIREKAKRPSSAAVLAVQHGRQVGGPQISRKAVHPRSTLRHHRAALITKAGATLAVGQRVSTHPMSIAATYRGGPSLFTTVRRIRSSSIAIHSTGTMTQSSSSTPRPSTATSTVSSTTSSSTARATSTDSTSTTSTTAAPTTSDCPCVRAHYYLCDPKAPACTFGCCAGGFTCQPGSSAPPSSVCGSSGFSYSYCCL